VARTYLSFLVAPIAFLLLGVWYFWYTKDSVKSFAKAQNCHPKYYLIAVLLQIGLLSLSEVNTVFLEFLGKFGYEYVEPALPSMDGAGFIGVLLVIAVLPAIMEDFFFRGIQLEGLKSFGTLGAVLLSGGLFALFHQSPAQTVYQFICGAAFALVAIKSGSILPTVLSHFINNGVILLLYKLGVESFSPTAYVIILVTAGLCLASSLVWLLAFDRQKQEKKKGNYGHLFACASVGIFMLLLSWCATLLSGV
jgi:membrane protease YdiL (CAAX protease family)